MSEEFRSLPYSEVAEKGVLCSILIRPEECCAECAERKVTEELFYLPAHRIVYAALMQMAAAARAIDYPMLLQTLLDKGTIEAAGGASYLTDIFTFLPTATNIAHYLDVLAEKLTLRKIIATCTEHAAAAYDNQEAPQKALEALEKDVLAIRTKRAVQRGFSGRDVAIVGGAALEEQCSMAGTISGLPSGFWEIDRNTDGMHEAEWIVLASRPSMGKSALAANIMEHLAIDKRVPCGFLSLEMGKKQLCKRLIASYARVNTVRWRHGVPPTPNDIAWLEWAKEQYSAAPMFFEESSDTTIQEIRAIGRRMVNEHGIRWLAIDSLSKVRSNSKQARDNRAREVGEASDGMKEMAKELQIPIFTLAHILRDQDKGEVARKPRLNDLRESGAIEQDADTVMMLWHNPERGMEIIGPKTRDGERDWSAPLTFEKEFVRFTYQAAKPVQPELAV